jgi:hypothetical protein
MTTKNKQSSKTNKHPDKQASRQTSIQTLLSHYIVKLDNLAAIMINEFVNGPTYMAIYCNNIQQSKVFIILIIIYG